jgi:hypothetical protein
MVKKPCPSFSKTSNKLFHTIKPSCPKSCVNASTGPNFSLVLCGTTEYLGGECEEPAFLKSLLAHIRSGTKGASAIGPQLYGEVFSPGGGGKKKGPI